MAQPRVFSVTAKKIELPTEKVVEHDSPYVDIVISAQEYIVLPSGSDDSLIITASGFKITTEKSISAIQTSLSSTDATGT